MKFNKQNIGIGIVILFVLTISAFITASVLSMSPPDEIALGEELTQEQMDSIPSVGKIDVEINDTESVISNQVSLVDEDLNTVDSSKYKGIPIPPPNPYDLEFYCKTAIVASTDEVNVVQIIIHEMTVNPESFAIYDGDTYIRMATQDDIDYYLDYLKVINETGMVEMYN